MRIITLHSDFIEFQALKQAIKEPEKTDKDRHRIDDCLVVLASVEKQDEENPSSAAEKLVENIIDIAKQVKTKTIVLYPYVHLSSTPAQPSVALSVLKEAEEKLKKQFKVTRAPFGWYKTFNIKCKGHPLSELSRQFGPGKEAESKAVASEKKLVSKWHVLDTKGKLSKIKFEKDKLKGFEFGKHPKFELFAGYEMAKVRAVSQEPSHVRYMRKLELVDYEPASDPGNLRYYPKGKLVKKLLETFVTAKVREYGAMEIESPIMYDYSHPALKSYLDRFPARQYSIQTPNKKVFLRFAACFGQFLMLKDSQISYRDLPLRMYELTRYSFRVEQHGELSGLRRLRAFTMPDTHAFCADLDGAKKEMLVRFAMSRSILAQAGLKLPDDLELAIRITKEFYENNKDFIQQLVKEWGKPALIEMWDERFFYFVTKYELNFVDTLNKASALTTDQIDIENAERYGITYVDEHGRKNHPYILHCSPSGAIERVMYALLEKAGYMEQAKKPPMLPLWLCPTQVRIIPVSAKNQMGFAEGLQKELTAENIRVDIDDMEESVGKRIMKAEREWVPYILVVGEREAKSKNELMVRIRELGKEIKYTKDKLIMEIKEKTRGMPYEPLPLNVFLSKRPIFVG